MRRLGEIYRRYASLRGTYWRLARLALVIGVLVTLRNGLLVYAFLAVAILDAYIRPAIRDGRPLGEIGLDPKRIVRDVALGFAGGAFVLAAAVGVMAAFGWYRIEEFAAARDVPLAALGALVLFALVAVVEEIVSRGMLFRFVERKAGTWIALGLSALVFGLLHMSNPNATLAAGIALSVEAGVLLAALYMATRSLWVPIGAHWSWNLFEGPIFGTPVSGMEYDVFVEATTDGPSTWTGGAFGPEGGLIVVIIGGLVGAIFIAVAIKRGYVRASGEWFGKPKGELAAPDAAPVTETL